jgi:hypothetical protein
MSLMVCMDFQKYYNRFIFIDDFLEEILCSQLKVLYKILVPFTSTLYVHISALHQ